MSNDREWLEGLADVYDSVASEYAEDIQRNWKVVEGTVLRFCSTLPEGSVILDVGCGVGLSTFLLHREGHQVTGVDLSSNMVAHARRQFPEVHFECIDFFDLLKSKLVADGQLDAIFAMAFIHLLPERRLHSFFEVSKRLLRHRGWLLATTTVSSQSSVDWEPKSDYVVAPTRFRRHWTPVEFRQRMETAGFETRDTFTAVDARMKTWFIWAGRLA